MIPIAFRRMKNVMDAFKSNGLNIGDKLSIETIQSTIGNIIGHTPSTKQTYSKLLVEHGYLRVEPEYGRFEILKFE